MLDCSQNHSTQTEAESHNTTAEWSPPPPPPHSPGVRLTRSTPFCSQTSSCPPRPAPGPTWCPVLSHGLDGCVRSWRAWFYLSVTTSSLGLVGEENVNQLLLSISQWLDPSHFQGPALPGGSIALPWSEL